MLPVKSNLLPTVSRFFEDDWNNLFDWTNRNFSNSNSTLPSVNIQENDEHFIVHLAAPGMKKEDFNIELKNNTLCIKGEAKENRDKENKDQYTRREFCYTQFQRIFNLNSSLVDSKKIDASYQDGILQIHLAKKEEAKEKPVRQIKIK